VWLLECYWGCLIVVYLGLGCGLLVIGFVWLVSSWIVLVVFVYLLCLLLFGWWGLLCVWVLIMTGLLNLLVIVDLGFVYSFIVCGLCCWVY